MTRKQVNGSMLLPVSSSYLSDLAVVERANEGDPVM